MTTDLFLLRRLHAAVGILMNFSFAMFHSRPQCLRVWECARKLWETLRRNHSRPQCLRVWECARKLWETLRRSSQNLAIWASQHMLFDPIATQTFYLLLLYLRHREVLCCFGIKTEEIQLTAVKNFQVSKAFVVAAEKIPLNVLNHR